MTLADAAAPRSPRTGSGSPSTRRSRSAPRWAASSPRTRSARGARATARCATSSSASPWSAPTASSRAAAGKVVKNVAGLRPAAPLLRLARHARPRRRGGVPAPPAPRGVGDRCSSRGSPAPTCAETVPVLRELARRADARSRRSRAGDRLRRSRVRFEGFAPGRARPGGADARARRAAGARLDGGGGGGALGAPRRAARGGRRAGEGHLRAGARSSRRSTRSAPLARRARRAARSCCTRRSGSRSVAGDARRRRPPRPRGGRLGARRAPRRSANGALVLAAAPPALRARADVWGPPPAGDRGDAAAQARARPGGAARARPLRGRDLMARADASGPAIRAVTRRAPRRRLRPLRLLPADLPDLAELAGGDGLAARPHRPLPRPRGRPGRDVPRGGRALRPLPRLHGVPHRLPVRRPLRPRHRPGARARRAASTRAPPPTGSGARPCSRSSPGPRSLRVAAVLLWLVPRHRAPLARPPARPAAALAAARGAGRARAAGDLGARSPRRCRARTAARGERRLRAGAPRRLRAAGLLPERERRDAARARRGGGRGGRADGAGVLRRALGARRARTRRRGGSRATSSSASSASRWTSSS